MRPLGHVFCGLILVRSTAAEASNRSEHSQLHCWLFAVHGCRSNPAWLAGTSRLLEGRQLLNDLDEWNDQIAAARCWQEAREAWINCRNAGLEALEFALAPKGTAGDAPDVGLVTGSYPSMATLTLLQQLQKDPKMRSFSEYQVSFYWAEKDMTQFSDIDLSRPGCNDMWRPVKEKANLLAAKTGGDFCGFCLAQVGDMWAHLDNNLDFAEFPFSSAKADCFLGDLTMTLSELLCTQGCGEALDTSNSIARRLWMKVESNLEGLFFFLDFPFAPLAASGWPVLTLLRRLGKAFRQSFGSIIPNNCDLLHGRRSDELFSQVQILMEAAHHQEREVHRIYRIRKVAETAKQYLAEVSDTCPFAVGTAMLSLLRATQLHGISLSPSDFSFLSMDTMKTWDALNGERVAKRHFFYDLLTTRWPWILLVEQISQSRSPRLAEHWPVDEVAVKEEEILPTCMDRVMASRETWEWHWTASPFQAHGKKLEDPGTFQKVAERLCKLDQMEVLFLAGATSGFTYGSFTVRGRQAARGLRQMLPIGPAVRARAWNQYCTSWCNDRQVYGQKWSDPAIIVHVKFPCKCAVKMFANTSNDLTSVPLHVYDPVDVLSLVPDGLQVILAQTSLGAKDYASHPSVLVAGTQVFWHPLHHSNFQSYRVPWREKVQVIGTHTAEVDTKLYLAVNQLASSLEVEFSHINPATRFARSAGLVISPQQTDGVYKQLGEMDITFMRQASCMAHLNCSTTRAWLCDRYKTGQRLVNAFSVGLPAVFWNQQGFLDLVRGTDYPAIATSVDEMLHWIRELVTNSSLRFELREKALKLSEPYSLDRLSQRLALILSQVLEKT